VVDLVIEYEQRSTSSGVVNCLLASHPRLERSFRERGVEFLHVGERSLAEPSCLDGYLFFFLCFAMEHADRMIVRGPVTNVALRNARMFQEYWRCWMPDKYRIVDIEPEVVLSENSLLSHLMAKPSLGRAIGAFSGGADGTFLALRHATDSLGPASYVLNDVVMVHGFDVSVGNQAGFDGLRRRIEPLIDDLGVGLKIVRTNARANEVQNWGQSHGAQLACVLHQFSNEFDYGLIGSTEPYNAPSTPWGSNPSTDYLLSGGVFEIVHDGAGYSRTEKIELISQHSIARNTLKVCWEGADQDRNCGECEKCVRTRLNFAAVGDSDPPCFDTPMSLDMVRTIRVNNRVQLMDLESIVKYAEERGLDEEWLQVLKRRVDELQSTV